MENFELVQKAYDELVTLGAILFLPNNTPNLERKVEEQKAFLTRRAAYYLNQVNPALGLLEKTFGNNVMGYSVDIIISRFGTYYDIATDDGNKAYAVNAEPQFDDKLIERWRQPTKELAGLGDNNGEELKEIRAIKELIIELQNSINTQSGQIAQMGEIIRQQDIALRLVAPILQDILDKISNPPPATIPTIHFPTYTYTGRGPFGINITLTPNPPTT